MTCFNRKPLFIAISSVLFCTVSSHGFAQQTTNPKMDEVVVVGSPIRDSQQAAIDAKRNADNYVDIVSADVIGRFPDQNLADSLGRLPGMAIERDQGQARYINFRGAPFRWTNIAFDGIDVPGAENGRVPRFDSIPSVITSRVEANKAILPNMPGESVAGFVNIHTYDPFNKRGVSVAADYAPGKQDLGDGDVEKMGLRVGWSNDHFGLVAYTSENSREQITDNREYDLEHDAMGELVVNELDFRSYKVKREDSAHGARLEYRGDETLQRLYVSTLSSEFIDNEERNQFVFDLGGATGVTGSNIAVGVSRLLEDGDYKNATDSHTLGSEWIVGDWELSASITQTDTEFSMDLPIPRSVGASVMADYDLRDLEDPLLYLQSDINSLSYAATIGLHYVQALEVENTKYKLDAETDLSLFGLDSHLATGIQLDTKDGDGFIATPVIGAMPVANIESFNTGEAWDSKTTNSIGATYFNNRGLRDAWAATGTLAIGQIADSNLIGIEEDINAVYAMITTNYGWGNVVVGARVEQTDYTSTGTLNGQGISVSDDFVNFLPSVHLNVDLTDDLKFRTSLSSGVNRPNYSEWRAAASIDIANQRISGGNPFLEAEEAVGFDTALEWYFAPSSIVSIGAFYRKVDNVIYADSELVDAGGYLPSAAGEIWQYTGSVNGKDGELNGIEFNFIGQALGVLPEPIDGFGIAFNASALNSEFKALDGMTYDLPGTSDLVYNASLFYEKYGLSARVNYQYRDEWISPIESPDEVWGETVRVDFSISYDIPLNYYDTALSIYANANNLTDEIDKRYAGNGTVNQRESFGKYYQVGLRLSF